MKNIILIVVGVIGLLVGALCFCFEELLFLEPFLITAMILSGIAFITPLCRWMYSEIFR